MKNEKNQVFSAAKWKLLEKFGSKGVQVIIQIVLARILLPDDYGTLAILTVFIGLANVFIQSGFSTSLIQKLEADDEDFSTCFYASLVIAVIIYAIIWFASPYIARFYEMPEVKICLRVLAVVIFAGVINSIQYAYISRKLEFRKYTIATIISSFVSGVFGIFLAHSGFGVWSLIFQQILANTLSSAIMIATVGWRPKLLFSLTKLKSIWSYGSKIMCMGLLNSLYSSLYTLVIGKAFSSETLGLYNRADQFPNMFAANVNDTVQAVTLPVLSQKQNEKEAFLNRFRIGLKSNAFILVPCMLGMAAVAPEMVAVLLTNKWMEAVPLMRLMCCIYATYPIHTMNIQAIKASGRSDIVLLTEIIKKVVEVSALIITVRYGIKVMLTVQLVMSASTGFIINTLPTKKLYKYGFFSQLSDVWKIYTSSILMMVIVIGSSFFMRGMDGLLKLLLLIIIGFASYVMTELLLKDDTIHTFIKILRVQLRGPKRLRN